MRSAGKTSTVVTACLAGCTRRQSAITIKRVAHSIGLVGTRAAFRHACPVM